MVEFVGTFLVVVSAVNVDLVYQKLISKDFTEGFSEDFSEYFSKASLLLDTKTVQVLSLFISPSAQT